MTDTATANPLLDVDDSDVALMLRIKGGDDSAFSELFTRYSKRLVSFAHRIIRDRRRAEELVQDAFFQIHRVRDRYTPPAQFSTFVYRVVVNNCANEVRPLHREKTVPEDSRPLVVDAAPGPDDLGMERQMLRRVGDLVHDLPFDQRAALLLSRVEGFDDRQVASCLGVSELAVKSLVFRAMRVLREGVAAHDAARCFGPQTKRPPVRDHDEAAAGAAFEH